MTERRQADDGARGAGWAVAQGPDATVRHPSPAVECPRCREPIHPSLVADHGAQHRRADRILGNPVGGPPLAAQQVARALAAGARYPWTRT